MDISRFGWRWVLAIATFAMFVQQAFSYVCQIVVPILADRVAEDFGISRGWLGLYLFIQNFASIVAAVGCGGFIVRYGPLWISQITLLLMGCSLLIVASGILWLYPIGAILLGAGAVSTPASSHILAQVCPPRLAPFVFSLKQTGVPVGSLIAGLLIPFLLGLVFYSTTLGTTIRLGTYGAAGATAILVLMVGASLEPIREYFDRERQPGLKISVSDLGETIRMILTNYALRDISFAAFAFGGLQGVFAGFFVLFLLDGLDYSETSAGTVFAIASFSAIWARILWGVLGSSLISPRVVLGGIGLVGGASALLMTWIDHSWTFYQITAVAVLYNISALSWHGILLAEIARLSPPEQVGGITGGVLSFTSIAMMIYPAIFGLILAGTDSYKIGFALAAIPSFVACAIYLAPPIERPWRYAALDLTRRWVTVKSITSAAIIIGVGVFLGVVLHDAP